MSPHLPPLLHQRRPPPLPSAALVMAVRHRRARQAVGPARLAGLIVHPQLACLPRPLSVSMAGGLPSMHLRRPHLQHPSVVAHQRLPTWVRVPHLRSGNQRRRWLPSQIVILTALRLTLVLCQRAGGAGSMQPLPSGPLAACRLATREHQDWYHPSGRHRRCVSDCWQPSIRSPLALQLLLARAHQAQAVTRMRRWRRRASSGGKRMTRRQRLLPPRLWAMPA